MPRRNSPAFIGCLPARCSSSIRIAPAPQATAAVVEQLARRARALGQIAAQIFTRSAALIGSSNQAPGNGDRPWIWRNTARAGLVQSIRASSLSILAA